MKFKLIILIGLMAVLIVLSGCVQKSVGEQKKPGDKTVQGTAVREEKEELEKTVLVIGKPSEITKKALSDIKELKFRFIEESWVLVEDLNKYKIILLDQTGQENKSVSRAFAENIKKFVESGGKLIGVMDSATKSKEDSNGIGWETVFKSNLVPVSCSRLENNEPSCLRPFNVIGRIFASGDVSNHPIMKGVEEVPADPAEPPLSLQTFDVRVTGEELAFIEDVKTYKTYPGIVVSKRIMGKVVWFNYEPGITPEILKKALDYN